MQSNHRKRAVHFGRLGRHLVITGWLLFLASLLLPVVRDDELFDCYRGWNCAWLMFQGIWGNISSSQIVSSLWDASYCLANLIALFGPLLLWKASKHRKAMLGLMALYVLATLNAGWLMIFSSVWESGYYAWLMSFVLLSVGFALASKRKHTVPESSSRPRQRTLEELAAEKELKEYLRFRS